MTITQQQLWDAYQALPPVEQQILQVLSVLYEPTNQTTLQEVLRGLGYEGGSVVGKFWRERMLDQCLVELSGNQLRCASFLCNSLTWQTVKDGSFAQIAAQSEKSDGYMRSWMLNGFHYNPWRFKRRLRNALFRHEEEEFLSLLGISTSWEKPAEARSRALLDIAVPLVYEWFYALPESFRYQLLRYYMDLNNTLLGRTDDGYAQLQACSTRGGWTRNPSIALLAEQELYRMNWDRFDELAGEDTSYAMLRLHACKAFLLEDRERALALFQQALSAKRKESGKRAVHVEGIAGVFYCLALVGSGSAESLKHLNSQITAAERNDTEEMFAHSFRMLQEFRDIWDGRVRDHDSLENYERINLEHRYPFEVHILGLAYYWLDKPLFPALREQLEVTMEQARKAPLPWQAGDIESLLEAIDGRTSDKPSGLAGMMPRLESWERALEALSNLAPKDRETSASRATQRASRLVWMLSRGYGGIHMQPREQKPRKNGGWTSGRSVSLKRLAEESETLPFLAPEDLPLVRRIRRDTYGYGAWYLPADAIAAAAGHPRVFWQEAPGQPVAVVRRQPELIVTRRDQHVAITMYPDPYGQWHEEDEDDDDYGYFETHAGANEPDTVIIDGANRIDVFEFDAHQRQIARILSGELRVPASASDRVVESLVAVSPLLTVHSDLPGIAEGGVEAIEADSRLYVNMQPAGQELTLNIGVQPFGEGPRFLPGAGGETVFAEIDGQRVQATRDLGAERKQLDDVLQACPGLVNQGSGAWSFIDVEDVLEGLLAMQQMEDRLVFAWPAGKKIKLRGEAGVSAASLSVRGKTDWFEIDGELRMGESEVLDMQKLLALLGDSPGRFIRLGDDEFLALTTELRQRLDKLRAIESEGKIHALAGMHLDELSEGMALKADKKWQDFKARLQTAREITPELPTTFEGELRDYQLAGYNWLVRLATWGAGACLADDMGLGKTIQALALILSRASGGPTLVVAPTSVCANWVDEALKFTPTLNPIVFGSGDRERIVRELKPFDVLICSYGLLASAAGLLTSVQWCTIVADEAQAFKNANTLRSKSVMNLDGEFRMITTGTPIENHLGELWNLFNFINPGLLGSLKAFNTNFARPIENGDEEARRQLRELISPFVLRRLKHEVLEELPPRTDITLTVELSVEEAALYEALRREAMSNVLSVESENQRRMIALVQITRLRQAACNPALVMPEAGITSSKLEMFGSVVAELLENRHKVLVFSQFVTHLALVRDYLDEHDIAYQYLDGSTRPADRKRAVTAFQAGEGELFLISLKAGGTGLNLTAANYVIHLDPWWNPAVEDQASDRAHRIGQQRPVTVYRLVAADTIEQKIVELHRHKRELADTLLEGTDIGARMTLDEMVALIG